MNRRTRIVVIVLLAVSVGGARAADQPPTRWRSAQNFLLMPPAPGTVSVTIQSYAVGTSYPDTLYYVWVDSAGKTLARGTVPLGSTKTLTGTCQAAGPQRLRVDPGRNAFSLSVGVPWCVELGHDHTLRTITHMRRLYFVVSPGTRELPLSIGADEASTIRLYAPDGHLVAKQSHEQYKALDWTVPVAPGQAGVWSVEGDLQEDLALLLPAGVVPFVAEKPEWAVQGPKWARSVVLLTFDGRMCGRGDLLAQEPAGPPAGSLSTGDGMSLSLDAHGRVASLKLDGQEQVGSRPTPLTGWFVRDVGADDRLLPLPGGQVRQTKEGLEERLWDRKRGLRFEARWRVEKKAIFVDAEVFDTTGRDRALCVVLILPIRTAHRRWWDGLDDTRPLSGPTDLTCYAPQSLAVGSTGHESQYPLACVSGRTSLAWAVPLNQPRVFRLGCSPETGQVYAAFDLGLSRRMVKSPGRATCEVVLYRSDPAWGFRAALKRYYDLFPSCFEQRMKEPGGWVCWGNMDTIPKIEDYGFRYHWGPDTAEAVAEDNKLGLYSFLYSDSVRYYCDLGVFDSRPTDDQARSILQAFLDNPDPLAALLSAPAKGETAKNNLRLQQILKDQGREAAEAWLRRSQAAVKRSAMRDAKGRIAVGYIVHYEGTFPPKWWTGRVSCDLDPDLPGGYGQFVLHEVIQPTFRLWQKKGARLSGVGLDNYYVDSNRVDYSREHLAYADLPACFTRDGKRVVLLGAFETYEWVQALDKWLRGRDNYVMNNAGILPFPFDASLMDIVGFEWNLQNEAEQARILAYHKPVVSLPVAPEHWKEPWIERCHVRFDAFPGGYAKCATPENRALYKKYLPALLAMARAGWEPITRARSDSASVRVERFGGQTPEDALLFSVTNVTDAIQTASVTLEPGLVTRMPDKLTDLIHGIDVPVRREGGRWVLTVKLDPYRAICLRLRG